MTTTTVASLISSQGTELLEAILNGDYTRFSSVLNKKLKKSDKICRFCTTEIRHKTRRQTYVPAELAVRTGSSMIMKYMLSQGLSPNHGAIVRGKTPSGGSLLLQAVAQGAVETADVLLQAGADSNMRDISGEVPLHVAVRKLNSPMVRLLLSRGADPCLPDRLGDAPLHAATHSGHLMIVSSLLKHNADVYQKGGKGTIAPQIAAREGHAHILEVFCRDSALCCDINVCVPCFGDGRARAPIHLAAERGHFESLSVLVEDFNADVHVVDSHKNTALHYLVLRPYNSRRMRDRDAFVQSAGILVEGGANVNARNQFGDTCLHLAVMNGYQSVVQVLLESEADPTIENKQHLTPSDVIFSADSVTQHALHTAKKKHKALKAVRDLAGIPTSNKPVNPFNPDAWKMNQTMDIDDAFMLGPSVSCAPTPEDSLVGERRSRSRSSSRSVTSNRATRRRAKSVDGHVTRTQRPAHAGSQLVIDSRQDGNQVLRDLNSGQVYVAVNPSDGSDTTSKVSVRSGKSNRSTVDALYARVEKSAPLNAKRLERSKAVDMGNPLEFTDQSGRYMDSSLSQVSSPLSSTLSPSLQYTNASAVDKLFTYNNENAYTEIDDVPDKTGTGHAVQKPRKKTGLGEQGDSVKVSMIPGKPGALEVEYGGKTLEICVDQEEPRQYYQNTATQGDKMTKTAPQTLPKPNTSRQHATRFVHQAQVHATDPAAQLVNILHGSQQLVSQSSTIPRSTVGRADTLPDPLDIGESNSDSSSSETEDSEAETVIPASQAENNTRPRIKIGMRQQNTYANVNASTSTFV